MLNASEKDKTTPLGCPIFDGSVKRGGMNAPQKRWGDWVAERCRVLGVQRHSDLATVVGCRRQQISRWVNMSFAPRMQKGFDLKLARALQTTQEMLFSDWVRVPPETAQRVYTSTAQDIIATAVHERDVFEIIN